MFEGTKKLIGNTMSDMYSALQAAGKAISDQTDKTLDEFFSGKNSETAENIKGQTAIILTLLHTGDLPPEWYLRPVDLDEEFQHFNNLMDIAIALAVVFISFATLCLLVLCGLALAYCSLKTEMRVSFALQECCVFFVIIDCLLFVS